MILIHGWEGSAEAMYVMSTAQRLMEQGFDVFRLNPRDHGPSHHLNPELFHSNRIGEVVGAVGALAERYRPEALMLAGFSLGGNFCLRVAARAPAAAGGERLGRPVPIEDPGGHALDRLHAALRGAAAGGRARLGGSRRLFADAGAGGVEALPGVPSGGLPGPAQIARLPLVIAWRTTPLPPVTASRRTPLCCMSSWADSMVGSATVVTRFSGPPAPTIGPCR